MFGVFNFIQIEQLRDRYRIKWLWLRDWWLQSGGRQSRRLLIG